MKTTLRQGGRVTLPGSQSRNGARALIENPRCEQLRGWWEPSSALEVQMQKLAQTAVLTTLSGSLFLGSTANATEWHVDNSGPAPCSDSSEGGSESRPWCTINYAVDRTAPGDIVYVKNGTYSEEIYIE